MAHRDPGVARFLFSFLFFHVSAEQPPARPSATFLRRFGRHDENEKVAYQTLSAWKMSVWRIGVFCWSPLALSGYLIEALSPFLSFFLKGCWIIGDIILSKKKKNIWSLGKTGVKGAALQAV